MKHILLTVALAAALTVPSFSQSSRPVPPGTDSESTVTLKPLGDKPLDAFRSRLLSFATDAATLMPSQPHLKTRSRLQELVGDLSLTLGQARRAEGNFDAIANWRRGAGFADLAYFCAGEGEAGHAARLLGLAESELALTTKDEAQGWRGDRIRAKMARALIALNKELEAGALASSVDASELGPVLIEGARGFSRKECEAYLEVAKQIAKVGVFEQVHSSLLICADLFGAFYGDVQLRKALGAQVRSSWKVMPITLRIELLLSMANSALASGDSPSNQRLLDEADNMLESFEWKQIQDYLPLLAKAATQRHLAGDEGQAHELIGAGLVAFERDSFRTADIYHARSLRPLAEALAKMGDTKGALALYKRVLEVGMSNPNSRPRAEDFVGTCCSMAEVGVEPTESLWGEITAIFEDLGAPW